MADFDIKYNGANVDKLVIPSDASTSRQLMVVWNNGNGAGKLVQIETSCVLYLSSVNGNLDSQGHFSFIVGPGFGLKGNATLTVGVGMKKKSLELQFI